MILDRYQSSALTWRFCVNADLREAIIADPTNPIPRWMLAERWGEVPEAELVRILMEPRRGWNTIRDWFERYQVLSPEIETIDVLGETVNHDTLSGFLWWAFDPIRWPDRAAWHAGVVAVARRMLPLARAHNFADDRSVRIATEIAASKLDDPPLPWTQEPDLVCTARLDDPGRWRDHTLALAALNAGRMIAGRIYGSPFESFTEASSEEVIDQYHVLGWAWLGLPPLRPEATLPTGFDPSSLDSPPQLAPAIPNPKARSRWWSRLLSKLGNGSKRSTP